MGTERLRVIKAIEGKKKKIIQFCVLIPLKNPLFLVNVSFALVSRAQC